MRRLVQAERQTRGSVRTSRPAGGGEAFRSARRDAGLLKISAPAHPICVHFTIALTASSGVFDALGSFFNAASLTAAGWWALVGAVLVTPFTLSSGLISRMRLPMEEGAARSFLRAHMAAGPIFYGLLVAVGVWRVSSWQAGRAVTLLYLSAFAVVLLVMLVQGYLGGELVYRYGAEVEGHYRRLPVVDRESPGSSPETPRAGGPARSEME